VRVTVALLTLACCAAAAPAASGARTPAAHAARTPKFQLRGDWAFHGERYRFSGHGNTLSGKSLKSVRIGRCVVRRGSLVFDRYRFSATHGGLDYWKGRLALVGKNCKRRLVSSTITVESDLSFSESSRLPGGRRPPPSTFRRIRPPVSSRDPVLGTWLRNGAGVVVTREGPLYVGRAKESFDIANGCTVPAGSVVWRLRPLAPDRYSGIIETFLDPPGCAAGPGQPTTWRFGSTHAELIRESTSGQAFAYSRG
jgi:hypothetical protein